MKFLISLATRIIPRHYLHRVSHFCLKIIGFFYTGNKVEDPISGKTFRKFLPYGRLQSRQNALSPDTLSLERHRLMWLYLKNETNFFSELLSVLHIAPEYCFIKRFKNLDNLKYTTGDLNSPWADIKMDINKMPFDDNSFDVVFCNHVLEHIPDDKHAMQEILRVMKPAAWGILQVPQNTEVHATEEDLTNISSAERERRFRQKDHYRLYGMDYGTRLKSVGFEVEEIKYAQQLGEAVAKRFALPFNETLYIVRKPA